MSRKQKADDRDGGDQVQYLTGPQVAARYNVTAMTIWRWLQDEKLNFPRPTLNVRKRRFWRESELVAWERNPRHREVA
jgi:predicted DNA-binding transcriptional regulator AlpA